jgi:hypothetical protein
MRRRSFHERVNRLQVVGESFDLGKLGARRESGVAAASAAKKTIGMPSALAIDRPADPC